MQQPAKNRQNQKLPAILKKLIIIHRQPQNLHATTGKKSAKPETTGNTEKPEYYILTTPKPTRNYRQKTGKTKNYLLYWKTWLLHNPNTATTGKKSAKPEMNNKPNMTT
jgi:hypothetical protein